MLGTASFDAIVTPIRMQLSSLASPLKLRLTKWGSMVSEKLSELEVSELPTLVLRYGRAASGKHVTAAVPKSPIVVGQANRVSAIGKKRKEVKSATRRNARANAQKSQGFYAGL